MAAKKPVARPAKASAGAAKAAAHSKPLLGERAASLVWFLGSLALGVALLCYVLPFLAELAPPGVNLMAMAEQPDPRIGRDTKYSDGFVTCPGKPDPCDGMKCPDGWMTSRKPNEPCTCICKRAVEGEETEWDRQRQAQQQLRREAAEQARFESVLRSDHEKKPGGDPRHPERETPVGHAAAAARSHSKSEL